MTNRRNFLQFVASLPILPSLRVTQPEYAEEWETPSEWEKIMESTSEMYEIVEREMGNVRMEKLRLLQKKGRISYNAGPDVEVFKQ